MEKTIDTLTENKNKTIYELECTKTELEIIKSYS